MSMVNLTQHPGTADQEVVDLQGEALGVLKGLLTFNEIPNAEQIRARAAAIADLAENAGFYGEAAMIGGAGYLMAPLQAALSERGIESFYAFTQRVSVETVQEDGKVVKTNVFKHTGFVPACF